MGASYKARVRAYFRSARGRLSSDETQRVLLAMSNEQLGLPADVTSDEIHGVRLKLDALLSTRRAKRLRTSDPKRLIKSSA